ncbi:winged helix-turn-helix domain-containing protein [Alteromonas sp. H39]|uniref:winged helix-turn-helix domain-containing protein n=1 Tax=Alteromonas sp. H39 TaxID=3389876 RepID=UPI0039E193C5
MKQKILQVNHWVVDIRSGELFAASRAHDVSLASATAHGRLEPKGTALLTILAESAGQLVDKESLIDKLWPGQVVTDDALTRVVSRLRKSLEDDPKSPEIIETIPKRGYRLIASDVTWLQDGLQRDNLVDAKPKESPSTPAADAVVARPLSNAKPAPANHKKTWIAGVAVALLLAGAFGFISDKKNQTDTHFAGSDVHTLVSQADDYYAKMRRQDNEMAIALYQNVIAMRPDAGVGQAGLANALVQQVLRWPNPAGEPAVPLATQDLSHALASGRTVTPDAKLKLERALALAQQAVAHAPNDARAHKALGFVYAAQQQFPMALASYADAIALDSNAWDALINTGDVLEISGRLPEAMTYYERAFEAMGRVYNEQSARIHPWYADMAALIGDKYVKLNRYQDAEVWYRRTLRIAPYNFAATKGLAAVLKNSGDVEQARQMCQAYKVRIGDDPCQI